MTRAPIGQGVGAPADAGWASQAAAGLGDTATIPSAGAALLYELYDAAERGAFATACDGRTARKLAWRLDQLGLARWCGTNWGSSFFAITDAGKAHIDAEVTALRSRLDAQAIEARRAETGTGSVEDESAVPERDAP